MRSGVTWIIIGALAVVGVFAGVDALRSSAGEPPAGQASGTDALTTTGAETDADLESSPQLRSQEVTRLRPGRVRTNERFGYVVTFRVPREAPAWYGFQDDFGFSSAETSRARRWLPPQERSPSTFRVTRWLRP
jgi:hypothetical protein